MAVTKDTNPALPQEPPKPTPYKPPPPVEPPSDFLNQGVYANVAVVERESKGTLSSENVLYLAGLSDDQTELVRLARVFSKRFETPPKFFFGDDKLKDVVSPITGEPMTARELRRFTQDFEPVALAAMLSQELGVTPEEFARIVREKGGTVRTQSDVEKLVKATASVSRVLAREYGDELTAPAAIALALQLAKKGVKPQVLADNLQYLQAYMGTGQGQVDPAQVRNWAIASAVNGQRFRSIEDVQKAVFGGAAVRERNRIAADIAAYEAATGREYRDLTPEETEIVQRMNVEGGGLAAALESPSFKLSPDFWTEVERVQADIALDEHAYENSLVGKAMDPITRAFEQTWEWTQQGLLQLGSGIVGGATGALAAAGLDPQGEGFADNWDMIQRSKSYAWERLKEGDTVGTFVAEGYGLPSWTAPAFDLFVGWYVDPFVIAGKAAQWRRAGRLLPGMTRAELTGNALLDIPGLGRLVKGRRAELAAHEYGRFVKYVNDVLPKSSLSKRLFKALNEGNRSYFRELDKIYGIFQSRGVFDYEYMKLLRDRLILRYGRNGVIPADRMAEARQAWEEGLKAHYLGFGPEGSVAAEAVTMRILQARNADQGILGALPTTEVAVHNGQEFQQALGSELLVPRSNAADVAESVIRENVNRIPFSPEVPAAGLLSTVGPRRAIRSAMYSERLSETRLGRRIARLPSLNPGRTMNLEEASDEYALLHTRRWAQFTDDEARIFQSRMVEIENKGGGTFVVNGKKRFLGREAAKEALIDEINRAAIGRIGARYGLTEETIDTLTDTILNPYRKVNGQSRTFGVLDDKRVLVGGESRPLLESQLQNQVIVVDPVEAIRDIRQYVGMRRRFKADFIKALGKEAPEINAAIGGRLANLSIGTWEFLLGGGRAYQRMWKAFTVARPGYIPRVILGDENLRFLATTESIAERMLSQRLTMFRHGPGSWLDDSRLFARELPDGQKVGLFDEVIEIGGEYVVIPRPGSFRYDYEPMAANRTRQVEVLEELLTDANTMYRARKNGTVAWDVLRAAEAGENDYVKAWQWVLEKQFRNSAPGRIALESIVEGDSIVATKRKLLLWAQDDGFVTLRTRMGIEAEYVDDWADKVARLAHAYTLSDTRVATLALNGENVETSLRDFYKYFNGQGTLDELPAIHGPTVADDLPTAERGPIQTVTDGLYTAFVRLPEDVLNRQPFYRTWKRRAERGYLRLIEQEGKGVALTPEVKRAIDVASRNFALDTVKKIMFDFTRQSRFTEVLQLFFPFPQPFFEGFQAWGHIAWRNPEAIGRARAIYQLGVDSGFLEEDPRTGEIVVPMGAWWSVARKMGMFHTNIDQNALDKMNLSFVAPLSSFNMLSMSSMRIPSGGFIGKVAGGVPIPLPGMNPPIQWLAQKHFAGTRNDALQSWLYQYGPSTQLMPSQITRVLRFFAPDQFSDDRVASYSLAIQERWQQLGIDRNPDGSLMPVDQVAAESRALAQELIALHGFIAMWSPGSLRVQWGNEDLKKEWADLLDTKGDYISAREAWDEAHPDLPLVPIANTYYTDPVVWEELGKIQRAGYEGANAPRVPASPFTQEMLNTPGIGDFMRNNPPWAALALVGIDAEFLESQDFSAFSNQLAAHMTAYKDPLDFAREGRDALAWREVDKFYSTYWNVQMDKLDRRDADTQDDFYQGMIQDRQEAFLGIALAFPDFADRYFAPVPGEDPAGDPIGYEWKDGSEGKPMGLILRDARQIVSIPGFQHFPGFQELQNYLDLRDEIARKMADKGMRFLDDMDGEALWGQYEKGVNEIIERQPVMAQWLSSYFGVRLEDGTLISTDDLMGNVAADRILARRGFEDERLSQIDRFDLKYEALRDAAYKSEDAELGFERSDLYYQAQAFMDSRDPKLIRDWWKVQSKSYRAGYLESLATKPPVFYSRFDWQLAGVKLSPRATDYFDMMARTRVHIAELEQAEAGTYSESVAFEAIDAWVRDRTVKSLKAKDPETGKLLYDKTFADAVQRMNRWSFPLEVAGFVTYDEETGEFAPGEKTIGKSGAGWVDLAKALMATQAFADAKEMMGTDYGTEENRDLYSAGQSALADWVRQHAKNIPAWGKQWDSLKEEYGDVLIGTVFMPDKYFGHLGEVDD